ncbi:hypothetical protein [Pseudoduganella ginsengisoli]|uniref:Uncharacterized protein n=1 Tax=Pseudoduganella ginsengisoli TaxID=1462440 RepID=A0A6L6Q7U4_9BURK|nr:hypothetical protein [Pseudoduganella ginsengisoli]MTW05544.1 hypothetical protein [Pseudoduganella ginsengisoli]
MNRDQTGDFIPEKVLPVRANTGTGVQIQRLLNDNKRAIVKCIQRNVEREGWPVTGAAIKYGLRISAEGKLAQVSVLNFVGTNDALLMACIGRLVCDWKLDGGTESQEQLLELPINLTELVQGRSDDRLRH